MHVEDADSVYKCFMILAEVWWKFSLGTSVNRLTMPFDLYLMTGGDSHNICSQYLCMKMSKAWWAWFQTFPCNVGLTNVKNGLVRKFAPS